MYIEEVLALRSYLQQFVISPVSASAFTQSTVHYKCSIRNVRREISLIYLFKNETQFTTGQSSRGNPRMHQLTSSLHCFWHIWQNHRSFWSPFALILFAMAFGVPASAFPMIWRLRKIHAKMFLVSWQKIKNEIYKARSAEAKHHGKWKRTGESHKSISFPVPSARQIMDICRTSR